MEGLRCWSGRWVFYSEGKCFLAFFLPVIHLFAHFSPVVNIYRNMQWFSEARLLGKRCGTSFSQLLITAVDSGKPMKVFTGELTYENNLSGRLGCQWYACVI